MFKIQAMKLENNITDSFSLYKSIENLKGSTPLFLLFRKEFIENRKTLIFELAVAWGACILLGGFLGFFGRGGGISEVIAFYLIIQLMGFIFGSMIFSDMKNKKLRISTLMLPAAVSEKFLMKWLIVVPGMLIIGITGFFLGDFTRILVAWLCDERTSSTSYYDIVNPFMILGPDSFTLVIFAFASYLLGQSIYIFGGILWPKLSFLKTFAALYCLEIVFGILLLWFHRASINISWHIENENNFLVCLISIEFIFTIFFYWLTYKRFKNSEVIYRLF